MGPKREQPADVEERELQARWLLRELRAGGQRAEAARSELSGLGDEAADVLVAMLRMRGTRIGWVGTVLVQHAVLAGAAVAFLWFAYVSFPQPMPAWLVPALVVVGLVGAAGRVMLWTPQPLAAVMARLDDVRLVGPMAEALATRDEAMGKELHAKLTVLLLRLTPVDAGLLNRRQLDALCRQIERPDPKRADFQLAILEALANVGDEAAVPAVRALAELKLPEWPALSPPRYNTLEDRHPAVREARLMLDTVRAARRGQAARSGDVSAEDRSAAHLALVGAVRTYRRAVEQAWMEVPRAAQRCLAVLEERLSHEHDAARLLRPAEAPAATTLLRPAAPAAEAPAEQLLRPVEGRDG